MAAPNLTTKALRTRMLKASCDACGYIVRVTRKPLEAHGPPICPCNSEVMRCDGWRDCQEERDEVRRAWQAHEAESIVVRQVQVKRTRSESTCAGCGGEIPPGDCCQVTTLREGGRLIQRRLCDSCQNRSASYRGHESCENRGAFRGEY